MGLGRVKWDLTHVSVIFDILELSGFQKYIIQKFPKSTRLAVTPMIHIVKHVCCLI